MFFRKTHSLLLLFFLISSVVFSQQAVISGFVKDAGTKQTLPGVTVFTDDKNATNTNETGFFELKLNPGDYKINTRYIGYKQKQILVSLGADEKKSLDIFLESESKQLGTVVVSAGKFEQKIEEVTVSMAVVKSSLIENGNHTSLEDALEGVTGLNINEGQANIR